MWKTFSSVLKNPVVSMVRQAAGFGSHALQVMLGIIYNLIFGPIIPTFIDRVLTTFGGAFGATALFLLGLSTYGARRALRPILTGCRQDARTAGTFAGDAAGAGCSEDGRASYCLSLRHAGAAQAVPLGQRP